MPFSQCARQGTVYIRVALRNYALPAMYHDSLPATDVFPRVYEHARSGPAADLANQAAGQRQMGREAPYSRMRRAGSGRTSGSVPGGSSAGMRGTRWRTR